MCKWVVAYSHIDGSWDVISRHKYKKRAQEAASRLNRTKKLSVFLFRPFHSYNRYHVMSIEALKCIE